MSQPIQTSLIPERAVRPPLTEMHLDRLPPDYVLAGSKPDKAFIDSVGAFGILQPILVVEHRSSKGVLSYEIAAGRRRVKAARVVGLSSIPARIYPADWVSGDVLALVENEQRSTNLAVDLEAIARLVKEGHSEDEIAKAVGLSKSVLRSRMKLLGLSKNLRGAFLAGSLTGTVAAKAARLSSEKQAELEQTLAEKGKLTESDLRAVMSAASLEAVAMLPDVLFQTPDADVTDWKIEVAALIERAYQATPMSEEPLRHLIFMALRLAKGGDQSEDEAA